MDDATIRRLNAINCDFYRAVADDFDQTRGQAWAGWGRLLPHIRADEASLVPTTDEADTGIVPTIRVLDVGCGNGRFGVFLHDQLARAWRAMPLPTIAYHGIDNNAALLERARAALDGLAGVRAKLEERDIIEHPPDVGAYNLVALFGVLHHLPGAATRQALMRALAERVAPGGLLVFACWRFYEYPRFRERVVPMPGDVQVEPGDYLLDWRRGRRALRYCHYVDDAEHAALIAATGLSEVESYRADGELGGANKYSILRRSLGEGLGWR